VTLSVFDHVLLQAPPARKTMPVKLLGELAHLFATEARRHPESRERQRLWIISKTLDHEYERRRGR